MGKLRLDEAQREAPSVRETAEVISRIQNQSDNSGHPLGEHYKLAHEIHVELLNEIGRKRYEQALVPAEVRAEIANQVGPEIWRKFHQTITDILLEQRSRIWNPTIRIDDINTIVLHDSRIETIILSLKKQHRTLMEGLLKEELKKFMSEVEEAKQKVEGMIENA